MSLPENKNFTDEFKKQTVAEFCKYLNETIKNVTGEYYQKKGISGAEIENILSGINADDTIFNNA